MTETATTKTAPEPAARIERRGPVGWITLNPYQETQEAAWDAGLTPGTFKHIASEIGDALDDFRYDTSIRVVVITGAKDGEFYRVCRNTAYDDPRHRNRLNPIKRGETLGAGWRDRMELLALIEKPVIARMNGDAIGLGAAMLWGCDLIIAREDAVVADVHTGMTEVVDSDGQKRGFPWAVTPGDGTMSFASLYMPPTKLKEYLFTSEVWTARQLAEMNIINKAVPADQLDATLDAVIEKLLRRPAYVLAQTKKLVNKRLIEQWNLTQDLAMAYENLDFFRHGRDGEME
jgi:enoyl-CoA hydratase/carnithine racemase